MGPDPTILKSEKKAGDETGLSMLEKREKRFARLEGLVLSKPLVARLLEDEEVWTV